MDVETNRQVVLNFCRAEADRDMARLHDYATQDATWWVSGRQDRFPFGGERPYHEVVDAAAAFVGGFHTWNFEMTAICADADWVMIQAISHGAGPGAAQYHNSYAMHFAFAGGKIRALREYLDPLEVLAYLDSRT